MRVGVNARAFSDSEPDGAAQAGIELTRRLIKSSEWEVVLYGPPSVSRWFDSVSVRSSLLRSDSQLVGVLWERTVLPVLAEADEIDVLLCPNANAPPLSTATYKVVMYIHDINAMKGMSSRLHRLYRRMAVPTGARVADAIVTVSEFSKREIVEHTRIPAEMIHVIYNGIDGYFHGDESGEPIDLPESYILYVGAMNPRKNLRGLLDAYDRLKTEYGCEHRLVIVGPRNKFMYDAMDVDVSRPDIVTPGYLSREQLKFTYEHADLFAFLSKYEGFGLPPLEAMACGTPVVASEASALPEILNGAVEFVDPEDTDDIASGLWRVLVDPEHAVRLVQTGRDHASQFRWDRTAEELDRLLLRVSGGERVAYNRHRRRESISHE